MGTEELPGFDCYKKAEPGEAKFTLLGRDPTSPHLIRIWEAVRSGNTEKALQQFSKLVETCVPYYQDHPSSSEQLDNALVIANEAEVYYSNMRKMK